MDYFEYGQSEIAYLKSRDSKFGELITEHGFIQREVIKDPFVALMSQIVGQQISMKALKTIWNRLLDKLGEISPESVCTKTEIIRTCGISQRKVNYMQGIAKSVLSKELILTDLIQAKDQDIIDSLVKYNGIGPWSAEMFLIFCLNRPNVFSYKDLAIKKALIQFYSLPEMNHNIFNTYFELFSPYASVASLYLWESLKK